MAFFAQPMRSSAVKCWWCEKTISASLRRWFVQDRPALRSATRNASISFAMSSDIPVFKPGSAGPSRLLIVFIERAQKGAQRAEVRRLQRDAGELDGAVRD